MYLSNPYMRFIWGLRKRHRCCRAARRFLTSSPTPEAAFNAQQVIRDSAQRQGDAKALGATLTEIKPPSPAAAAHVAMMTTNRRKRHVKERIGHREPLCLVLDSGTLQDRNWE